MGQDSNPVDRPTGTNLAALADTRTPWNPRVPAWIPGHMELFRGQQFHFTVNIGHKTPRMIL